MAAGVCHRHAVLLYACQRAGRTTHVLLLSWGTTPNAAALAAGPTVTTVEHCGGPAKVQPTTAASIMTMMPAPLTHRPGRSPAVRCKGQLVHANGTPPDGAGASTMSTA
jgi:hypothetical protein